MRKWNSTFASSNHAFSTNQHAITLCSLTLNHRPLFPSVSRCDFLLKLFLQWRSFSPRQDKPHVVHTEQVLDSCARQRRLQPQAHPSHPCAGVSFRDTHEMKTNTVLNWLDSLIVPDSQTWRYMSHSHPIAPRVEMRFQHFGVTQSTYPRTRSSKCGASYVILPHFGVSHVRTCSLTAVRGGP